MPAYNEIRQQYRPAHIKVLFIAESPPPAADVESSRQFYRADRIRIGDRLFTNTMKALFAEARTKTEQELEQEKSIWLKRFQEAGYFMIEALEQSQPHEATKPQRQERIKRQLPHLLKRVGELAHKDTAIILIKSNVFVVAAKPLRQAGFTVLNTELVDYPGRFNQGDYRRKVASLLKIPLEQ